MILLQLHFFTPIPDIGPVREKGRYLTQSYDKSPNTNKHFLKARWQYKNATKGSITTIMGRLRQEYCIQHKQTFIEMDAFKI